MILKIVKMDKTVKKQAEDLLRKRDFDHLIELCESDRRFWQEVRFRLYEIDESLRWSAIETAARLMKKWWDAGREEKVRRYIRTLFWSMNDESGGIGWSSPQVIAEIVVHIPALIDPYGSMMIAYSIEEPPLIKACLWGIGRLGKSVVEAVDFFQEKILAVFGTDDAEILGLASWAMGEVGFYPAIPFIEKLFSRSEPVAIYIDGDFIERPLGHWVQNALRKIRATDTQDFSAF